jgi:bifunctional DNase/RNase
VKAAFAAIFLLAIAAAIIVGIAIGAQFAETPVVQAIRNVTAPASPLIDRSNFVPAEIGVTGATVSLTNSCYRISFDVTGDQAFSILHGVRKEMTSRPLTHDIMKDVLGEFGIDVVQIRIERFGDEIYYARAFLQSGDRVLDLDLRPSDAIALSLRTGDTLYINQTMLQEKGNYVC